MQKIILDLIKINGLITLDDFLFQSMCHPCHGYYNKLNPIQRDFTTSPEITNAFGIIIANYILEKILSLSNIDNIELINFIEFGCGSGKLVFDIANFLNKLKKLNNEKINTVIKKISFHLIEFSKTLKEIQKNKLKNIKINKYFYHNIQDFYKSQNLLYQNKKTINIFFSNEFFDTLPIKQFIFNKNDFLEIIITEENNKLLLSKIKINPDSFLKKYFENEIIIENAIIELPIFGLNIINEVITIMKHSPSLFITFDYGFLDSKYQSTLQGIYHGKKTTSILENIGDTDITHLVNFSLIAQPFKTNRFNIKIETQRDFLLSQGITSLITENNQAGINRLIDIDQMGHLFKVLTADNLVCL